MPLNISHIRTLISAPIDITEMDEKGMRPAMLYIQLTIQMQRELCKKDMRVEREREKEQRTPSVPRNPYCSNIRADRHPMKSDRL